MNRNMLCKIMGNLRLWVILDNEKRLYMAFGGEAPY